MFCASLNFYHYFLHLSIIVHCNSDEIATKSEQKMAEYSKKILEYERRLRAVEFENKRLLSHNSDLQLKMSQKIELLVLEEQQSSLLREQLEKERFDKSAALQRAVNLVSQHVSEVQQRRSDELQQSLLEDAVTDSGDELSYC
jgi:hypothetical protein